jgi:hypothetical protein
MTTVTDQLLPKNKSDHDYLHRSECPCCGASVDQAHSAIASSPAAEVLAGSEHGRFLSGYSANRVFFSYHRCAACGLLYCPIYYTQAQLDRLYGRQAENMAEVSLEARQLTQSEYVPLIARHSSMTAGFLELGADIGLFARECAEAGHFEKFWLYEPNLAVHDELRSRMNGYNVAVRNARFRPEDIPAASVSTSALIHVLDHLLEPREVLEGLRRCLQPGGVVLVVTHDCASPMARLLGRRWPPYTLQHPQLFSKQSLHRMLENSGFKVLEIVSVRNFFSVTHLVRAGLGIIGLPCGLPDRPRPLLGLRLGNIAGIARRK